MIIYYYHANFKNPTESLVFDLYEHLYQLSFQITKRV